MFSLEDNHWFMINYSYDDSKFNFFALSGAVQLNENQIIVFGGRDEKEMEQQSFCYFQTNDDGTNENEETRYHFSEVSQGALPWAGSFANSQTFYRKGRLFCLSKAQEPESPTFEEKVEQQGSYKVVLFEHGTWKVPII